MTVETQLPPPAPTSTSRSARQVWTRSRGVLLGVVLLLVAAVAIAAVRSTDRHGSLDPRSADPAGSRAIAELLADHGVSTRVVSTLAAARAAAGPDTTLLVAVPDLLTPEQQQRLHATAAVSGGRTVLVAPDAPSTGELAPGVIPDPLTVADTTLPPDCALPAARRAGNADTGGGIRYAVTDPDADACYPSGGMSTLVRLPAATGNGDTVVLGSPGILYNQLLDEHGNASLALQLLGSRTHLVWYLPSLSDDTATDGGASGFFDLIPRGWLWGTLQLFVAAAIAALWRGRRHGPLVAERLPVAVRASETAEGRARLYRRVGARDRGADALRSATRTRLAKLLGLPASRAHTPEALLPALTARTTGGELPLHALLFGPPPRDDAALVLLADQLDALEREVRRP